MTLTTAQLNKAVVGTTLILRNLQLNAEDIKLLGEFLNAHSHITSVDLFNNDIGEEGAKVLAGNTTLITLNVGSNRIRAEGAKALAGNTTLTTLDVGSNRIGDEGAKALAANTILTTLNLRNNKISDEGAKALATNTTLTTLDVSNNAIGDKGAKALAANTTLTTLDVSYNSFGAEGANALIANYNLQAKVKGSFRLATAYRQAMAAKNPLVKANFLRTTAKINAEVPSLFMFCLFKVNTIGVKKENMEELPLEIKEKLRPL